MKKILLSLLMFVCATLVKAQLVPNPVVSFMQESLLRFESQLLRDSVIGYDIDGNPNYKIIYFKNNSGLSECTEFYQWDNKINNWGDVSVQTNYQYDNAGREIKAEDRSLFEGDFRITQITSTEYNSNSRILKRELKRWNGIGFDINQTDSFKYDDNNNLEEHIYQSKDSYRKECYEQGRITLSIIKEPSYSSTETYTYKDVDANHYTVFINRIGGLDGIELESIEREDRELDDNGNVISISYFKKEKDDDWYISMTTETTYDTRDRVLISSNYASDGSLVNRDEYVYTGERDYTHTVWYPMQTQDDLYTLYIEEVKTKKGNPEIYSFSNITYNEQGEIRNRYGNITYTYYGKGTITSNESVCLGDHCMRVFTQKSTIHIELPESKVVWVYSVNGKCFYSGRAEGTLYVSNLPAGIYVINVGERQMKVRLE